MSEESLDVWSNALSSHRDERLRRIANDVQAKGDSYTAKDFFDIMLVSLDQILMDWWDKEQATRRGHPSVGNLRDDLVNEMESVVDFEIEAIRRDAEGVRSKIGVLNRGMDQGFEELERFGEDLKKNYLQKIESFVDKSSQSPADESEPLPSQEPATASPSVGPSFGTSRPRNSYSGSSGPSGLSLLFMLILGLALGGGASFYFRDQAQKADQSMRERVAQLETEKRAVEDNMAMYQQTFAEIANGKMKTLPQLDAAMAPIRKAYAEERKQAEKEFLSRKENLMKKVSAGDRLSKLIQKLEQTRNERIESLNVQERSELEPYLKQRQVLNELIANR